MVEVLPYVGKELMPNSSKLWSSEIGTDNWTLNNTPATSYSNAVINFQIAPNNGSDVVPLYKMIPLQLTWTGCTGLGVTAPFGQDGLMSIRNYPFDEFSYDEVSINNTVISNQNQLRHSKAIRLCQDNNYDELIEAPYFEEDLQQSYANGIGGFLNPMRGLQENVPKSFPKSRGSWNDNVTVISSGSTITVQMELYVPLSYSPFDGKIRSLKNIINNMLITVNINGNVDRAISGLFYATGFSYSVYATPYIYWYSYNPPSFLKGVQSDLVLPYYNYLVVPSSPQTLSSGTQFQISSLAQQLSTKPSKIFIYVAVADSAFNTGGVGAAQVHQVPDVYQPLSQVTVQWGNNSTLFSNINKSRNLYEISRRNGLKKDITFELWRNHFGSLFCIKGSDLDEVISGKTISPTVFQTTVVGTPFANANLSYQYSLFCVIVYEGYIIVHPDGSIEKNVAPISNTTPIPLDKLRIQEETFKGEGILDNIQDFLKKTKIISGIARALKNVPGPVGTVAAAVEPVADNLGYGSEGEGEGIVEYPYEQF